MVKEQIGFIGLGNMGGPMAGRLLDAGYPLTVFDTREAAMKPLLARGAQGAVSAVALASRVKTVLVCLPTPDIVRQVAIGPGGIAEGTQVKTFVDLSTTGPRAARQIAAALEAKGITAVDSPVSGGVGGAKKGSLALMASCPRPLFDTLQPILAVFGKPFYLGDKPGLGQTMKLANNLLSATALVVTSEAMVMGVKAGLDPQVMLDVINAGSGRNSASQDKFPARHSAAHFRFRLHQRPDAEGRQAVRRGSRGHGAADVGRQRGAPGVVLRRQPARSADQDFTTIVQCLEQWAGVEVKGRSEGRELAVRARSGSAREDHVTPHPSPLPRGEREFLRNPMPVCRIRSPVLGLLGKG